MVKNTLAKPSIDSIRCQSVIFRQIFLFETIDKTSYEQVVALDVGWRGLPVCQWWN